MKVLWALAPGHFASAHPHRHEGPMKTLSLLAAAAAASARPA